MQRAYLPLTDEDRKKMLEVIGVESVEDLFADIPDELRYKDQMNIPPGLSEMELANHMKDLAGKNLDVGQLICFRGAGAYDHYLPAVVDTVISRAEFYTAYTPYQAEVSQGVLQSIYEYQTVIAELTGMDVSNASMYDGSTAMVEAVILSQAISRRKKGVVISSSIHPEYRDTLETYSPGMELDVRTVPTVDGVTDMKALEEAMDDQVTCVILQTPNFFGLLEKLDKARELADRHKAHLVVVTDPTALSLIKPPGEAGADIVVGEGQPLGNPMGYGGPYLGFFACREKFMRRMGGRISGMTTDNRGQRGFVLTLQAREQHIRRERATSNICSNEALCALAALVYVSALGKEGMREVAELCLEKAHYAAERIAALKGYELPFKSPFFKEFVVSCPEDPAVINERLLGRGILGGVDLGEFYPEMKGQMLIAVTEKRSKEEIDQLVAGLEGAS